MKAANLQTKHIHPMDSECVRILQITDSHIFSEQDGKLLGLDTRKSFEAVKQRFIKEEIAPDFLLATGDLSQDASENSYQYLRSQLISLNYPCFWIPGNHDVPSIMEKILQGDNIHSDKRILTEHWQVVLLDTSVPGKVYGHLSKEQIGGLVAAKEEFPEKHLLVVLHHQPVPVGSEWLDNLGLKNAEELFAAVSDAKSKVCFLWGHVHQDFVSQQKGIQLISTPSTCVQFAEDSSEFSAGKESPGYRYITLHNDGRIETVLHRVDEIEYTVDYTIKGY